MAAARRQQEREDPEEVEWIYLRRNGRDWVARRTPRHFTEDLPSQLGDQALLASLIEQFLYS